MNPGLLRDRISVYTKTIARDPLGGAIETETLKGSCWARVLIPRARDGILAMQDVEIRTHEVTTRVGPAAPEADDIIIWNNTRLRVRGTRPDLKMALVIADCVSDRP